MFSARCHVCVRNKHDGFCFAKAFGTYWVLQNPEKAFCEGFFVLTLFGTLSFSVLCPSLSFQDPWFGFEQEYYLIDPKTKWPLGWPAGRYPDKDTDAWHNNCMTWQNLAKRPTWYRLGQGVEFANPATSKFMSCLNKYNIYVT